MARDSMDEDVTCRECGESFTGATVAMALRKLGKHASEEYYV